MSYSCTAAARFTEEIVQERFRHENSGNTFTTDGGKTIYFSERGREQTDGAITGTILKMLPNDKCRRAGGFRIEADGKITRFQGVPKKFWPEIEEESKKRYFNVYGPK